MSRWLINCPWKDVRRGNRQWGKTCRWSNSPNIMKRTVGEQPVAERKMPPIEWLTNCCEKNCWKITQRWQKTNQWRDSPNIFNTDLASQLISFKQIWTYMVCFFPVISHINDKLQQTLLFHPLAPSIIRLQNAEPYLSWVWCYCVWGYGVLGFITADPYLSTMIYCSYYASFIRNKNGKTNLTSYHFFPLYVGHCETCNFFFSRRYFRLVKKWLFLIVFSYLKNNKNSRSYRCSNIAKTRGFHTFRMGLLRNLTWWSNSEPGFGLCAQNYFGNVPQLLHNKTM